MLCQTFGACLWQRLPKAPASRGISGRYSQPAGFGAPADRTREAYAGTRSLDGYTADGSPNVCGAHVHSLVLSCCVFQAELDVLDMKVLLVSNGFQPNYEKAFANGLAANGVDVVLVSSDRTLIGELAQSVEAVNLPGSQSPHHITWIALAVSLPGFVLLSQNGALWVVDVLCAVELMQTVFVIVKARQYWKRPEVQV